MMASQGEGTEANPWRVGMVAGEASGDLLAGLLLRGLRTQGLLIQAQGVGGQHMQAQGFDVWSPSEALSVRGYVEVLRHYRRLVALRDQLTQRWLLHRPDVFVGVDAPDFNLELARRLKAAGIKTVHFVCPSIWAWRAERVAAIKAAVDHVLCIFPFEPALLHAHGIAATFVGHPLAQLIPWRSDAAAARQRLGVDVNAKSVVALLPGSRAAEIKHLLPRFLKAARLMAAQRAGMVFVLPAVPALRDAVDEQVRRWGSGLALSVVTGESTTCMAAADVVLVASGTATLEVALVKRPMVIAYHMPRLSWWLHQRKRLQPWVGLPNILSQRFVVPELLQEQATPQALAAATVAWLDQPERVHGAVQAFDAMHESLRADTERVTAQVMSEVLCG
jgi:lipid-A-disaccharide synthase